MAASPCPVQVGARGSAIMARWRRASEALESLARRNSMEELLKWGPEAGGPGCSSRAGARGHLLDGLDGGEDLHVVRVEVGRSVRVVVCLVGEAGEVLRAVGVP